MQEKLQKNRALIAFPVSQDAQDEIVRMPVHILGVKIEALTKSEALDLVSIFLSNGKQNTIFTPNPEMLVAAHRDLYLREILNRGSLNVCDGKGLELIMIIIINSNKLKKNHSKLTRTPGFDFMLDICALAERQNKSVYLLGSGDHNVITRAAEKLRTMYPSLGIVGFHQGPKIANYRLPITEHRSLAMDAENDTVIADILATSPDILFVGFGHGKQEKWIHEHLSRLPSVKIAMGVGGSFDILGGKFRRAPLWMRKTGLEWLWRLILELNRIKRIWTAVAVFPMLVFFSNNSKE